MFACVVALALVALASCQRNDQGMMAPDHCLGFQGEKVPLNRKVQTSGYEYTCKLEGNDAFLVSTGCIYQGRTYQPGMEISNPFYAYACVKLEQGGVELEITACKELDGSVVKAGEKVERGEFVFQCAQDTNGYLVLQPSGCISQGTEVSMGSDFEEGSFWYKCLTSPQGAPVKELSGCVTPQGKRINPGEKYTKKEFVMQCLCQANKCTHQVVGCADENGKEHGIHSNWLQGKEPFRYLVSCGTCSAGTTITRSLTQCRYTSAGRDTMIDPGCMKKVGGKLVACGVNVEQGLQIFTGAAGERRQFRDKGFRDC